MANNGTINTNVTGFHQRVQYTNNNNSPSQGNSFSTNGDQRMDSWDASTDRVDFQDFQANQQRVRAFREKSLVSQQKVEPKKAEGSESTGKRVTVQPGDSLSSILLKSGFPREKAFDSKFHDEVAKQNNLKNKNLLYPGQVLNIPSPSETSANPSPNEQKPVSDPASPKKKQPAPVAKKRTAPAKKAQVVKRVQTRAALSTSVAIEKAKAHLEKLKTPGRQFSIYSATVDPKDKGKVYVKALTPENITPGKYAVNMTVTSEGVVITSFGFGK